MGFRTGSATTSDSITGRPALREGDVSLGICIYRTCGMILLDAYYPPTRAIRDYPENIKDALCVYRSRAECVGHLRSMDTQKTPSKNSIAMKRGSCERPSQVCEESAWVPTRL